MPRKNPVPASEKAIGLRLKQFRENKLISQTAFASELGISRAQLINYEEGLSPMPWIVGHRLNSIFALNPRWLITGKPPVSLKTRLPDVTPKLYRAPFSKVYHEHWKGKVETDTLNTVTFGFDPSTKPDSTQSEIMELAMTGWLQRIPNERFREFLLELSADAERIITKLNPSDKGPHGWSER